MDNNINYQSLNLFCYDFCMWVYSSYIINHISHLSSRPKQSLLKKHVNFIPYNIFCPYGHVFESFICQPHQQNQSHQNIAVSLLHMELEWVVEKSFPCDFQAKQS